MTTTPSNWVTDQVSLPEHPERDEKVQMLMEAVASFDMAEALKLLGGPLSVLEVEQPFRH